MRWGKTKVAVDFANCLSLTDGLRRVLVVCPLTVIGVWQREVRIHTPPDIDVQWKVINYEQLYKRESIGDRQWVDTPRRDLLDFDADLVIIDESHHIGNPTTLVSKYACMYGRRARFRLIMTGTMFHRKPFFTFGQAKFYDPAIFGGSFSAFKKRIAVFGGYGGYEVLRYHNLKWMMNRMKPWVFIEDYVPTRAPVTNRLTFHLTGDNLRRYYEMEQDSITSVKGIDVTAPIVLTRHLRCQQIAGGWIKDGLNYHRAGDDKLRMATARFQEYREQGIDKVVVGVIFIPELYDARRAAEAAGYEGILFHGKIKGDNRKELVDQFRTSDKPTAFISQINAGREGIDLSAADVMMFYSLTWSYVSHDQFSRRIERFNETRTLMYDYLLARHTRDEVAFLALSTKRDVAELIVKHPEVVERITRNRKLV